MNFYLVDNPLTKDDPNDLRAEIEKRKPKTHADLIKIVMFRCAGLTESQIQSVLKEYNAAIELFLEAGEKVDTEHYTVKPRIRGVFNREDENFTPGKHEVYIKMKPTTALKSIAGKIKVGKIEPPVYSPIPQAFLDTSSNTENDRLTPGGGAKLIGKKMKFNVEDPEQGIFLVNESMQETKITEIIDLLPAKVSFIIPTGLSAGTYTVRIKSDMGTKQIKAGDMKKKLTVS